VVPACFPNPDFVLFALKITVSAEISVFTLKLPPASSREASVKDASGRPPAVSIAPAWRRVSRISPFFFDEVSLACIKERKKRRRRFEKKGS